ncbi:hypothetical protein HISP_03990 [Haloarcula hispanica N601]|uniref:Uncharacterized protein n=2 Tax=Haloarcula hispanica TaxID=51589 RepID=A0A482TKB2_HALHI|nr:hypothetical protein HISP_03990 [Haloarcula hispanica N601]KAA9407831.1 hypothetical protein Har1131_13800 [Haloarcula sp. CBA1131]KAA9409122.1 hypothetical protein EGO51_04710 [Haloarcula hispanica]RYJ11453.1 hypothetical protein ELS20_16705 [Haloarcula hispanica]
MNFNENGRIRQLLIPIGGLALVIQSIAFESTFEIVESPGVSGTLRDVLSGGLLLVATVCLFGGVYLRLREA